MIALLVLTDGRDTIYETIPSALAYLHGPISELWIHDDSGDPANAAKLRRVFPGWQIVRTSTRSGFDGAIRSAWSALLDESTAPFVFHLEDDFRFRRPVDLGELAAVLLHHETLAQLALRRQPWNPTEVAAGGVVEANPEDFTDREGWLEHRRFFTTNPSLYRRDLMRRGWPTGAASEGRFSADLFADGYTAGYWGARASGEWVEHIGHHRAGTGY